MSPRNRKAFQAGQEHRAVIRRFMLEHVKARPLARPLTWKEIATRLLEHGIRLGRSVICAYMAEIRMEAELGRSGSDVSNGSEAA